MSKGRVTNQEREDGQQHTCQLWIKNCCETHPLGGVFTPSLVLYENFKIWQAASSREGWERIATLKNFIRRIETEGFRTDRQYDDTGKQVRGVWNITLCDGSGPINLFRTADPFGFDSK